MGSNYAVPTGGATGSQYGQSQGVNAPNTGAVPTTYGGVERANQLLRSLHEQPQASTDNVYNPSGQQSYQQGQQQGQQAQYNPSNVPAQGATAGNYPRGGGGYDSQAAAGASSARVDTRAAGYQAQGQQQPVAAQTAYRGQETQAQNYQSQGQGQGQGQSHQQTAQSHQQTAQGQPQGISIIANAIYRVLNDVI